MIYLQKKGYIFIALLHYVISLFLSLDSVRLYNDTIIFYVIEVLYLIIFIFIYKKLFYILGNINKYKNYIKSFIIYFSILFILLLLVWPGIWRWDELNLALYAKEYILISWQNILSSIFYIISLRTIPSFVGIVIIQCITISVLVSYIINKIYEFLKLKNHIYKIILYIPFLLLPVLDSNLYPLRSTLYSYIMIFYLVKMVEYNNYKVIPWVEIVKSSVLLALLSNLRSEGCYFLLITVVLSIILYKRKKIDLKKCIILPFMTIIIFSILHIVNIFYDKFNDLENYNITATVNPLVHFVVRADQDSKHDILYILDKVVDVQYILDNRQTSGIELFWTYKLVRYGYTKEQYKDYMKTYYKLCMMYPDTFFKQRINEFINSFSTPSILIYNSTEIFDYKGSDTEKIIKYNAFINESGKLSKPINIELRKKVIKFLEGRKQNDYYEVNDFFKITWNLIPPLICCLIGYIYLIVKRNYYYLFLLLTINIKAFLVFITSPSSLFMYYFSDYLIGYIVLSILIILLIKKIKELKNECSNNNGRIRNEI